MCGLLSLQLDKEVKELKRQLKLAHSQIEDLIREAESHKSRKNLRGSPNGSFSCNGASDLLLPEDSEDHYLSDGTSCPSQVIDGTPIKSEEICDDIKEVQCIEIDESSHNKTGESFNQSTSNNDVMLHTVDHEMLSTLTRQVNVTENHYLNDAEEYRNATNNSINATCPESSSSGAQSTSLMSPGSLKLTRSRSCRASLMNDYEIAEKSQSTPPHILEKNFIGRPEGGVLRKSWKLPPVIYGASDSGLTRSDSLNSDCSSFIDEAKNQGSIHGDEDIPTLGSFVAGLREMAKLQYGNEAGNQVGPSPSS